MTRITLDDIRRLPGDVSAQRPDPNARVEAVLQGMEKVRDMATTAREIESALRAFARDNDKNLDEIERLKKENAALKIKADWWDKLCERYSVLRRVLRTESATLRAGDKATAVVVTVETVDAQWREYDSIFDGDGEFFISEGWINAELDEIKNAIGYLPA